MDLFSACLTSILRKTSFADFEIILVDYASANESTFTAIRNLHRDQRIKFTRYEGEHNRYSINNLGASQASGDILVFIDNNIKVLESDWLEELTGWALQPEIGIVGAKILGPKWEIQHAGMILGLGGPAGPIFGGAHEYIYGPYGSPESYRNYMAVTGSCMAVRREVFEQLGGFDEVYRSAYGDIDLCLRAAEAGFRVVYTPYCRVQTQTSDSIDKGIPESDVTRITQAISQFTLNGDPYFNPNLSYRWLIPQIKENEGS